MRHKYVTIQVPERYLDIDLNFINHPIKGDISVHKDVKAIINSVKNLILTNHYERLFQPEIGSNIRKMLFEPLDDITAIMVEREIREVIKNYEPRVDIHALVVKAAPDYHSLEVTMTFFMINRTEPITIRFLLERIR